MIKRWQRVDGHLIDGHGGLGCPVSRPEYNPFADDRPELELQSGEIADPPRECCAGCGRPLIGAVP